MSLFPKKSVSASRTISRRLFWGLCDK